MNATGLPSPADLAEAIGLLGESTGHSMFGARLALAKGDVRTAYGCYLEHRRLVNARRVPRIDPVAADTFDGLDPAELLRRQAQLPIRPDLKGPKR